MKKFVVFFAIFIGIQGGTILNLDSPELLDVMKIILGDVQKTIAELPANKSIYLSNYKRYARNVNYSACPAIAKIEQDLENISPDNMTFFVSKKCEDILHNGVKTVEKLFNEHIQKKIHELFDRIDEATKKFSPQLEKINESLKKYIVKSAACELDEVKSQTCGALLVFEKQLHAHRDEIHKYLGDLDFVSRFLGPLADEAWAAAQSSFKNKISSLIEDCTNRQPSELKKSRYEIFEGNNETYM